MAGKPLAKCPACGWDLKEPRPPEWGKPRKDGGVDRRLHRLPSEDDLKTLNMLMVQRRHKELHDKIEDVFEQWDKLMLKTKRQNPSKSDVDSICRLSAQMRELMKMQLDLWQMVKPLYRQDPMA